MKKTSELFKIIPHRFVISLASFAERAYLFSINEYAIIMA